MERSLKERLERAGQRPEELVKAWKARTGGKAVGMLHTDVPEELIWAAGAWAMTVLAREVAFQRADKHVQGFACSYSRSVVELYEQGELDFLDGLIVPYACDTTRCLDLILKYSGRIKFHDCLRLPKRVSADGVMKYYRAELMRLGENLGLLTGQAVTPERLSSAIKDYNRVRGLLTKLRAGLREGRAGVSADEYISAVRAAMTLSPPESEPLLNEAVQSLGAAGGAKGVKVVLAGKNAMPVGLISAIETAGLSIIEDHLVTGGRWVAATALETGDPWDALARRQLHRLPFAGIWDNRPSRAAYLIERVKALKADAAVFLIQKFCEPAELDFPAIREALQTENIPVLLIESDYSSGSLEPLKTRIQAFAEMVKGKDEA